MDLGELYLLLKRGSEEERLAHFESLFPDQAQARQVLAALEAGPALDRLRALRFLASVVEHRLDPTRVAAFATAAHRFAVELMRDEGQSLAMILELGELATIQVKAQLHSGQYREALEFTQHWIPLYREIAAKHYLEHGTLHVLEAARDEARQVLGIGSSESSEPELGVQAGETHESYESPAAHEGSDDADGMEQPREESDSEMDSDTLGVPSRSILPTPAPSAARPKPEAAGETTPKPKPVSTGFARAASPGVAMQSGEVLEAHSQCYFWVEFEKVLGSIERRPTPAPVDLLPRRARLEVVLFSPDDALRVDESANTGELELQEDGGAIVIREPRATGSRRLDHDAKRRLLFPLRTGAPGPARLRCCIYCRGVLVQSRVITATVGGTERESRVDFTLATHLEPAALGALREQRFSMHINEGAPDRHEFYIHGAADKGAYTKSIRISAAALRGPLELARAALRKVSWDDEGPWNPQRKYRYTAARTAQEVLEDLSRLAIRGREIFDVIADDIELGGKRTLEKICELAAEPGLVQITADVRVGMVLPAALIYDYPISFSLEANERQLCPEFARAYATGLPLGETACFSGRCPSKGNPAAVCPSGFWGFRHALGLPVSCVGDDDEHDVERDSGIAARIEYRDAPLLIVGVSKSADLPQTRPHTEKLLALRPDWPASAWKVTDDLPSLMEAMKGQQPHLVYMYCHGAMRQVNNVGIPMLFFGADANKPRASDWFEKAMLRPDVNWSRPQPLVFLNGCHTTMLDETTVLNFVRGFVQNAHACGVIGTEITVFEPLADTFATRFMERFLSGLPVGDAVRATRLDLLQEGNPLGLVYTPFVLSDTKLVKEAQKPD